MIICFVIISIKFIQIEKSYHLCYLVYNRGKPLPWKQYWRNIISVRINRNIHIAPQSIDYPDIGGSTETLLTNSPNPFNGSTVISYYGTISLSSATLRQANSHAPAQIQIYDIKGQIVIVLGIENYKLGMNEIVWNGKDENSKLVASGIYFFTLKSNNFILETRKMILLRMK